MRILIVSQYFYPENFRINQLATALKQGGHDIIVLTGEPNYPSGVFFSGYGFWKPRREIYQGIEIIRVPLFPRGKGRAYQLILNYLSFVFFAIILGLPRLRGRFDVCIAWCSSPITIVIPAIVYRQVTRTPVAIWVQDLWPETFFAVTRSKSRVLKRGLKSLVRWIYKNVDQVWMQSPAYEASMLQHGAKESQLHFVPNWAEDFYDCARWAEIMPDDLPVNSLVFAGNLGRAQGLENLLDAAELLRTETLHWVFLGDGTLREWLEKEVQWRSLQKRVLFFSRRAAVDVPKMLKAAAAVLVTLGDDQVFAQTIPSKVQSCLAAGRPVIATLAGESARILRDAQCGFVVEPQNPNNLVKVIKDFMAMPEEERAKFGANGHAYYRAHFMQTQVTSRIDSLLEQMRLK